MQYREAQDEILRAQEIIRVIDRQRYDAEKEAVEARTTARTLNQQIMVQAAMEEGRKIGLEEGLKRGRALALQEAEMMSQYDEVEDDEYGDNQANHYPRSILSSIDDVQEPSSPERTQAPPGDVPPTPRPAPSPSPVPAPAPPEPTLVPPPIFHNQSRREGVYRSRVDIPPDGYIPELGTDSFIHMPPAYELSPSLAANLTLEQDPPGSVSGRRSRSPGVPDGPAAPSAVDPPLRHQPSWASDSHLK